MTCHILLIPPELRNNIYEHIFLEQQTRTHKTQEAPAILLTCRQIYHEARGLHHASPNSALSNLFAISRRLVFPPSVLRIIAEHVIEDLSPKAQPGPSRLTMGLTMGVLLPDLLLMELDIELLRAHDKYASGLELGKYFWHERMGLRRVNDFDRKALGTRSQVQ